MASEISEEKVQELTEILRQKFLQNHSGDPDIDPRDVTRIQESLTWISKFIRHQRGDLDNAYNHLMESLKWRKSFGINDIRYHDIDENLWKTGMAANHGVDRHGNQIVVLTIRMHHKDSKRTAMILRWVAFCYEANQRLYPDHKMCMVFDMAGAGVSNIDMDLMKFIINCFKIYFPDLLAWLLVYNMPWVLQAVWRIVQSWLNERAVAKVKFVTKETIQTYIHPDQLLAKFGGNDLWEYDFDTEKQRLLAEFAKIWPDEMNATNEHPGNGFIPVTDDPNAPVPGTGDPNASVQDPAFVSVTSAGAEGHSDQEAVEEGSGDEGGAKGEGKKVRFETNLPPSRQTRFGNDAEDEEGRRRVAFSSPDQRVLSKGSASDRGFRRRQVSKMIMMQGNVPDQEEAHSVGGESLHWRYSSSHLIISPSHELVFAGKQDSEMLCSLTLTNTSDNTLAYKIKTTAPTRYKVRPNLALIDKKSVAKVHVLLVHVPGDSLTSTSVAQDKFLVQSYVFNPSVRVPEQSDLATFWKSLPRQSITEHRMRCRLHNNVPKVHASPKHGTLKGQPTSYSTPGTEAVALGSILTGAEAQITREMSLMGGKVDKLVASSKQLSLRVQRLTRLNCAIIVLLILVLVFSFI